MHAVGVPGAHRPLGVVVVKRMLSEHRWLRTLFWIGVLLTLWVMSH